MKRASRRVKPRRRTAAMVVGDGLLLALTLTGLFLFQYNVYGLPGSSLVVLRACLVSAVLFLAVFSLPKYRWAVVLGLIALGLALLWRSWDMVLQGAQAVYHTIAHVITESTDFPGEFPIPSTWTESEIQAASDCFLTAIIFALALPLGWAVVRRRTFLPVLLLTLPWLIPIFLAEFPPDVISLSMLAACWIAMLLTGLTTRKNPAGGARLTLLALPAALLALYCICWLFPVESYVYPSWAASTAQRLTDIGESIQGGLWSRDAVESVDLSRSGPKHYTGRSVLKVESEWTGRVYLRGAAYASYTGDSWEQLSDEAQAELDSIMLDDSVILPMSDERKEEVYSATITHLNSASRMAYYLYQPVNLSKTLGSIHYVKDSYLCLEEPLKEYTVEFTEHSYQGTSQYQSYRDEAYSQFVDEHYLDVPEELAEVLRNWRQAVSYLFDYGYRGSGLYEVKVAQAYADFLQATTEYDLQTPFTPEGEDFIAYFLNESHRGYCVHYASAVTMLLRTSGIPARYVSGYTAEIVDGKALVPDSAAHAWVEVYVDGYGWYPVEVTPPAAFSNDAEGESSAEVSDPAAESTPSAEPTETPVQSEAPVQSETPAADPSMRPSRTPSAVAGIDGSGGGTHRINLIWLCYAAAVLAVFGVPILVRALRRRRWNRLIALTDNNQAVLEIYSWYHRLPFWGGKPDGQLEELARKARFSQHTLTSEERRQAFVILRREITRLSAKQPFWKRPFFWYWFVWK